MSAPKTNVEKEEKRHKPALMGIKGLLIFVAILMLLFGGYMMIKADGPQGADTQIDGRTGEEIEAN